MGGGKGGGGGHTPIEQPNTLESAQRLKIIDLLCEGVAGQDVTFKNIYLDNTPVQNEDGSYNFTGIRVSALPGTHNQDYLAGFDSTDKIVSVGAEVKASKPITRTITDPLVDSVRVTLALGSLVTLKDNGDRVGGSVSLTVKCGNKSYPVTISGKTTSAYHQDVVLTDLPDAPFNISVHRNTPDSTSDSTSNATHWVSYVESIDAKFSYPNSVVVGLEIDSAQFGGKIPKRTYLNKWTQIKVPDNYDPIKRTYDGIWTGEFKTAWSDNPAWVFYDLVTDKRYGLGDRLGDFGCDKWSLYQIAKYCDQIVPDGFGGEEPRFTCNAYLSEPRDAKALLDDLASVFRGIAVWDGQMVTALQDAKKDPVATYTNANVVDGAFAYSGAAQKTIFTAVHVKYNDKADNYATKTEYVANDDAIKRYGLNVKQVTAFGCTSRGQAARVGKWLIETSIREQQMVNFKVGREGIRHLPFDIIEIADNDYAGDMIAGRVLSVAGNTITADRAMSDIKNIRYYANGQSKTVSVQSINGTTITLAETPVGIEQLGVFSATKTAVKPRLFRALSIKEDDGTYTISAVQHDENKEAKVDQGVTFERDDTATKHTPQLSYGRVSKEGDELLIAWEGTNTTEYLIKIYKDGELYRTYTQDSAEIKLKGLPNGDYRAEIRGKSVNGQLTEPVIKEWSIDYDIKGLKATPELFAIKLDWTNPTTVINKAKIEIYRSLQNDRASATKVATLSYPTDTFTQNGVKLSETHYFWLRLIDDAGNTGDWVTVSAQCSEDASQIVESINGKITQTELAQSLINSLQEDVNTAKQQAIITASFDAASKVATEATARANVVTSEVAARNTKINDVEAGLITRINDVRNTTNNNIGSINTLQQTTSNNSQSIAETRTDLIARTSVQDTRNDNQPPSWYFANYKRQTAKEFKYRSAIDLNGGTGGYCYLETQVKWTDRSGGAVNQTAYTNDNRVFTRSGTTDTWSVWIEQESTAGSQAKVNQAKAALQNDIAQNTALITSESQARTNADTSLANQINTLTTSVGNNHSAIQAEQTTRANRDTALANQINTVLSKTDNNTSAIQSESQTRASADSALSNRVDTLVTTTNNNIGSINTLQQTTSNNSQSIAETRTDLIARTSVQDTRNDNQPPSWYFANYKRQTAKEFKYRSAIDLNGGTGGYCYLETQVKWTDRSGGAVNQTAYTNDNRVFTRSGTTDTWSVWIEQESTAGSQAKVNQAKAALQNDIAQNTALITSHYQALSNADSAQTVKTNQALSRINNAESSINTLQSTTVTKNKAQSTHTIKTQAIAGGKRAIAGIAVGAMANQSTAESAVIVMADKFGVVKNASDGTVKPMLTTVNNKAAFNGDLIADGTILGKHIKANQTLSAPKIQGGELNINNRFIVDRFGNLTGKSGKFEGDVVLKNGQVDTLQIKDGAVTVVKISERTGIHAFAIEKRPHPNTASGAADYGKAWFTQHPSNKTTANLDVVKLDMASSFQPYITGLLVTQATITNDIANTLYSVEAYCQTIGATADDRYANSSPADVYVYLVRSDGKFCGSRRIASYRMASATTATAPKYFTGCDDFMMAGIFDSLPVGTFTYKLYIGLSDPYPYVAYFNNASIYIQGVKR